MTTLQTTIAGVMTVAVAATLLAEARGRRAAVAIAKPLASACFVLLGALALDLRSSFGAWLLAGLALCMAGDICLIWPRLFRAGLLAFLLGHLAYLAAFGARLPVAAWPLSPLLALAPVAAAVLAWLWPHLGRLRWPIVAYVVTITAMVWGAWGLVREGAAAGRLAAGAIAFFLSDVAVARDRFVAPGLVNRLWGLPLYYLGQLLIATGGG